MVTRLTPQSVLCGRTSEGGVTYVDVDKNFGLLPALMRATMGHGDVALPAVALLAALLEHTGNCRHFEELLHSRDSNLFSQLGQLLRRSRFLLRQVGQTFLQHRLGTSQASA